MIYEIIEESIRCGYSPITKYGDVIGFYLKTPHELKVVPLSKEMLLGQIDVETIFFTGFITTIVQDDPHTLYCLNYTIYAEDDVPVKLYATDKTSFEQLLESHINTYYDVDKRVVWDLINFVQDNLY